MNNGLWKKETSSDAIVLALLLTSAAVVSVYGFYSGYSSFYADEIFRDQPAWIRELLHGLRWVMILAPFGSCLSRRSFIIKGAFATQLASFVVLHGLTTVNFAVWNYLSHVIWIYSFCLVWLLSDRRIKSANIVLLVKFVISLLYFQSLLSKLLASGINWSQSGQTINTFMSMIHDYRPSLLTQYSGLAAMIGHGTLFLEAFFSFGLFFRKTYRLTLLSIIIFHLSIFAVMRISFWHLTVYIGVLLISDLVSSSFSRPSAATA